MGDVISIPTKYVYTQATTPTDTTEGRIWYNTSNNKTYVSDGTSYSVIVDVDTSNIEQQQLQQDINILINSASASSTLNDYSDMFLDIFTDSSGELNTIDTGNTTGIFSTDKYNNINVVKDENNWFKFENNLTDDGGDGDITLTNNGAGFSSLNYKVGSYSLSVANNYVAMTNFPAINVANTSGSLFFWVYSESLGNHLVIQPSTGNVFSLSWGGGVGLSLIFGSTGTTTTDLSGAWHHLGVTWDNGTTQYYKDGVAWESAKTGQTGTTSTTYRIGKDTYNQYYQNYLDDFRLYEGKVLTLNEISSLYNGGAGREQGLNVTYADVIVQTNAETITADPTHHQLFSHNTTAGTGSITYDISFNGGTTWDTDQALNTKNTSGASNTGSSMIIKLNLNGTGSGNTAEADDYAVMLYY